MINKNVKKVFKDYTLEYNICIVGDKIYIVNGTEEIQSEVEIPFTTIECFKHNPIVLTQRVKAYDLKGIIKKNSEKRPKKVVEDVEKIRKPLLSTSREGQEIIRQFVEQGMIDARCQIIAVIVPQYIDAGFKGTLRHLARLSGKKVIFIELDELCELISINEKIKVS